jgi:hypothetical protein
MSQSLYMPSWGKWAFLAAIGLTALSFGFYLRYEVIEQAAVGIACGTDFNTWLCASRRTAIALFTPQAFGLAALGAALLNLLRPSLLFWTFALLSGGIGIVLYNTALSALAVAFLVLSLARPEPRRELAPEPEPGSEPS